MSRKVKFKPVITRVKLNPEQAVLSCTCFNTSASHRYWTEATHKTALSTYDICAGYRARFGSAQFFCDRPVHGPYVGRQWTGSGGES